MKLYNDDCLSVMKTLPDNSVDLTVTSPPYDNLRTYNGYVFDFEGIAKELYRVTKEGGVVVWVVGDATINGSETGTSFKQALYFKEIGFNLHDTMIFQRKTKPLTHKRYEQEFEYMFVLSKGKLKTCNHIRLKSNYVGEIKNRQKGRHREKNGIPSVIDGDWIVKETKIKGNIWKYLVGNTGMSDAIGFKHPAIFPEKLAHDHIISWSNEGDTVLDPMMGSGTTGKMAKILNRHFIGIEISKEYFEIATRRIEDTDPLFQAGEVLTVENMEKGRGQ